MTAPLVAPVETLCPLCRLAIKEDLSETLSKRAVMMPIGDGGLVWVHPMCGVNAHVSRAEKHKRCQRCNHWLSGESSDPAGPRRQHGIDEENYAICQDGRRSDDPTPFVDPYAASTPTEEAA